MGKPKSLSKKAKKLAKKKGFRVQGTNGKQDDPDLHHIHEEEEIISNPVASKYSIDQILDKATQFMDMYNYEMAQNFCQRALEIDNDNVKALETTASLLLEAGDAENAKRCLGRAITVKPLDGHTKYLSLAQLMQGKEALQLYNKAIEIIAHSIENQQAPVAAAEANNIGSHKNKYDEMDVTNEECNDKEGKENRKSSKVSLKDKPEINLIREQSNAYCAIAELWMTDLCDEDEAQFECGSSVEKAVESDGSNPEAWQTKARLHLVKSEFEDARSSIQTSLSKWLPSYTAVLENRPVAASTSSSKPRFDPVEVCPLLYTTRIATAKILIELEEWNSATQVLDGLIEEDEDVVDTWYLLGWLNKLRADFERDSTAEDTLNSSRLKNVSVSDQDKSKSTDDGYDTAEGYLSNARFYLTKSKVVHKNHPTDDVEMVS